MRVPVIARYNDAERAIHRHVEHRLTVSFCRPHLGGELDRFRLEDARAIDGLAAVHQRPVEERQLRRARDASAARHSDAPHLGLIEPQDRLGRHFTPAARRLSLLPNVADVSYPNVLLRR